MADTLGSDVVQTRQSREGLTYAQTVNKLSKYFGPPQEGVKVGAYDKLAVATNTLPDYYKGRNLFLRDTIDGFIFENNEWMTTLAFPWLYTDEHNIAWNEWHFNATLAGEVPPEGISRLITTSSSSKEAFVVRRGLAFILEHGFWRTPAGDEQYRRNILGIKQCVQETQNYDVSVAIRYCRNYEREYKRRKSMLNVPVKQLMAEEIDYFIVCQKGSGKLDYLITKMLKRLSYFKVTPDLMIAPKDFRLYYGKLDPVKTMYYSYGPDGVLALKAGPDAPTSIQGMTVVESRYLDISESAPPVDPMLDSFVHGTHYFLRDPAFGEKHDGYRTEWLDSFIYSEEPSDDFVKVQYSEAFKYCQRFDETNGGRLREEHGALLDDKELRRITYSSAGSYAGVGPSAEEKIAEPLRDMFVYRDDDGNLRLLDKLGNMELDYASHDDFRRAAQTLRDKLAADGADDITLGRLDKLTELLDQSAKVVPSQRYLADLIAANLSRSIINGAFTGQLTGQDSADRYQGGERIVEMAENAYGGLDFPRRPPGFTGPPPFLESWGQLMTLAEEETKDNGWKDYATTASEALAALKRHFRFAQAAMPSSEFLQARNRSPWFKYPRAEQTFFENLVSVPRDAVFLRVLPSGAVTERGVLPTRAKTRGPASKQAAMERKVDGMFALLMQIAGEDPKKVGSAFYVQMTKLLGIYMQGLKEKNEADRDAKAVLFFQALLAAALYGMNVQKPTDEAIAEVRRSGRSNLRKLVFSLYALAKAKGDKAAPEFVYDEISRLTALYTGFTETKYPAKHVQVADTRFKDIIARAPADPEPAVAQSEVSAISLQEINKYNTSRREKNVDYLELRQASDQIVASAIELEEMLAGPLDPPLRSYLIDQDYRSAAAALASAVGAMPEGEKKAGATERLNRLRSLTDTYSINFAGKETIDVGEGESEEESPAPSFEVGKGDYAKGIWVRAPLAATRAFAEDALAQETPLALPSDPYSAHLRPFDSSEASEDALRDLFARPAYRLSISDDRFNLGRSATDSTYARSLYDWGKNIRIASSAEREREKELETFARKPHGGAGMHVTKALRREQGARSPSGAPTTISVAGEAVLSRTHRATFTKTFVDRWDEGNKIADPLTRWCYHALLTCENIEATWKSFLDNEVLPLASLILFRPFVRVLSHFYFSHSPRSRAKCIPSPS